MRHFAFMPLAFMPGLTRAVSASSQSPANSNSSHVCNSRLCPPDLLICDEAHRWVKYAVRCATDRRSSDRTRVPMHQRLYSRNLLSPLQTLNGHRLKNDATLTNKALAGLACRRRVLLSGTPMQVISGTLKSRTWFFKIT